MFHRLVRTMDLYDGLRMPVRVGREELLLIHEHGQTWLVQRRCPHADFPLDRCTVSGNQLRCPGHGMEFSLRTGQCLTANYRLEQYRIDFDGPWLGVEA
ncbi:Rieske 2Fe-2S domain-containing protein [Alcanivorax sp. S6407]|uniref:Rieske (2Fe-2S) protein n=1 Tax=Alcanivorax sp. S6407 TaxID=2926424 RepID=UPI001FF6827D|nr:Rieske 2Fe-2S domain-containing protein [Alcanivorax sp. S6407]MCK0152551.1 Rieske 2Fe-2S domain-containing protein [Alcanivorax sp. S6407]